MWRHRPLAAAALSTSLGLGLALVLAGLNLPVELRGDPSLPEEPKTVLVGDRGSGWRYEYDKDALRFPDGAVVEHAHGIHVEPDSGDSITVTYADSSNSSRCLVRWRRKSAGATGSIETGRPLRRYGPGEFLGPGEELCAGVPHGLTFGTEGGGATYLYHANNERALHKTTADGDLVWSARGRPAPPADGPFRPTWLATAPDGASSYAYLADGYGSNEIYAYHRVNGTYAGRSFGGPGSRHGEFSTCHAISWDSRRGEFAVCDRENHRIEYYRETSGESGPGLEYAGRTVSHPDLLRRPCNIRIREEDDTAIVPALEGVVGILDSADEVLSILNVSGALGDEGFLHPHDAHFVPGTPGDFVLVTWNPGRIGYFRRLLEDAADPADT